MKIKLAILFLISIGFRGNLLCQAELPKSNLYSIRQIELSTPWLQTGNASGLFLIPDLFPAEIKLGFNFQEGDFHSIYEGKTLQNYSLSSRSYRKINKTYLYGSLNYRKGYEYGLNFSNLNSPGKNYPYIMADTIGNDTYDREFISLEGMISSPLSDRLNWGLKFGYEVGVAAQNRDPRPENKAMQLNVSPGFLYRAGKIKLGANFNYQYYNEDVDVDVIEANQQHTLFLQHGLGNYTYHQSSSFYRLYQQHQIGAGMQFDFISGNFSNLLYSRFDYLWQTVDDGRAASMANWSFVKNDARMDGINWNIHNVAILRKGNKSHLIETSLKIDSRLGTEYIQRLEKVGETDLERWVTYASEQKYYSMSTHADFNYNLMNESSGGKLNSLLNAGVGYTKFMEEYYLPNLSRAFSNLVFTVGWLKRTNFSKADFSTELKLSYKVSLEKDQNIDLSKPIAKKIQVPEFEYQTCDYFSPGIAFSYEIPAKKILDKYFIKTDFNWMQSTTGYYRATINLTTGIIF